jgi:hypothetical protein
MTTAPVPRRWRPFLLKPSAEKIEWLITQLDDVTEKEHFTACGALDWFKATLIGANVASISEEQTNVWLTRVLLVWIEYRAGQVAFERPVVAGPSKELLEVNAALGKWLNSPTSLHEKLFLRRLKGWMNVAAELFNATAELIDDLETIKKKTRGESAETRLQLELYYLYVDVTGEDGLSDGGPAHRFVKTFAAEIDGSVDVPGKGFAVLVRKARNRDRRHL